MIPDRGQRPKKSDKKVTLEVKTEVVWEWTCPNCSTINVMLKREVRDGMDEVKCKHCRQQFGVKHS